MKYYLISEEWSIKLRNTENPTIDNDLLKTLIESGDLILIE